MYATGLFHQQVKTIDSFGAYGNLGRVSESHTSRVDTHLSQERVRQILSDSNRSDFNHEDLVSVADSQSLTANGLNHVFKHSSMSSQVVDTNDSLDKNSPKGPKTVSAQNTAAHSDLVGPGIVENIRGKNQHYNHLLQQSYSLARASTEAVDTPFSSNLEIQPNVIASSAATEESLASSKTAIPTVDHAVKLCELLLEMDTVCCDPGGHAAFLHRSIVGVLLCNLFHDLSPRVVQRLIAERASVAGKGCTLPSYDSQLFDPSSPHWIHTHENSHVSASLTGGSASDRRKSMILETVKDCDTFFKQCLVEEETVSINSDDSNTMRVNISKQERALAASLQEIEGSQRLLTELQWKNFSLSRERDALDIKMKDIQKEAEAFGKASAAEKMQSDAALKDARMSAEQLRSMASGVISSVEVVRQMDQFKRRSVEIHETVVRSAKDLLSIAGAGGTLFSFRPDVDLGVLVDGRGQSGDSLEALMHAPVPDIVMKWVLRLLQFQGASLQSSRIEEFLSPRSFDNWEHLLSAIHSKSVFSLRSSYSQAQRSDEGGFGTSSARPIASPNLNQAAASRRRGSFSHKVKLSSVSLALTAAAGTGLGALLAAKKKTQTKSKLVNVPNGSEESQYEYLAQQINRLLVAPVANAWEMRRQVPEATLNILSSLMMHHPCLAEQPVEWGSSLLHHVSQDSSNAGTSSKMEVIAEENIKNARITPGKRGSEKTNSSGQRRTRSQQLSLLCKSISQFIESESSQERNKQIDDAEFEEMAQIVEAATSRLADLSHQVGINFKSSISFIKTWLRFCDRVHQFRLGLSLERIGVVHNTLTKKQRERRERLIRGRRLDVKAASASLSQATGDSFQLQVAKLQLRYITSKRIGDLLGNRNYAQFNPPIPDLFLSAAQLNLRHQADELILIKGTIWQRLRAIMSVFRYYCKDSSGSAQQLNLAFDSQSSAVCQIAATENISSGNQSPVGGKHVHVEDSAGDEMGQPSVTMSFAQLQQFNDDCGILGGRITPVWVQLTFLRVNREEVQSESAHEDEMLAGDERIELHEFIEYLCHVADALFPDPDRPLSSCLVRLLDRHSLLRDAMSEDPSIIQSEVASDTVQAVLQKFNVFLKEVFNHYGMLVPAQGIDEMGCSSFIKMLHDSRVIVVDSATQGRSPTPDSSMVHAIPQNRLSPRSRMNPSRSNPADGSQTFQGSNGLSQASNLEVKPSTTDTIHDSNTATFLSLSDAIFIFEGSQDEDALEESLAEPLLHNSASTANGQPTDKEQQATAMEGAAELSYSEFCTAVVATALHMFPDPFRPSQDKVTELITEYMVPNAHRKPVR